MGYTTPVSPALEALLPRANYEQRTGCICYADVLDWLEQTHGVDVCFFPSSTTPGAPKWYRVYAVQRQGQAKEGSAVIWNPLTQLKNPAEHYATLAQAFEVAIPAVLQALKLIPFSPTL
jgi:hypothetical protein